MLAIHALPALRDNYIWLLDDGRQAAVVDPGEAAPVFAALAARGLELAAILVTHHHADHQGGIPDLLAAWPEIEVFAPASETIVACTRPLAGGETIRVLATEFEVLAVPGHTRGHLAYYSPGRLFCGDTLFGAGCGRLFEGTPAQMAGSLARLAALPASTAIYPAHEYTETNLRFAAQVEPDNPAIGQRAARVAALRAAGQPSLPSTLADELATNPFLRSNAPGIVRSALANGAEDDSPIAVFAAIRRLRNGF